MSDEEQKPEEKYGAGEATVIAGAHTLQLGIIVGIAAIILGVGSGGVACVLLPIFALTWIVVVGAPKNR